MARSAVAQRTRDVQRTLKNHHILHGGGENAADCNRYACRGSRVRPTIAGVTKRRSGEFLDTFLQQMVNGLTLGSVYAIVALGYTMVYGIIQLINFAHGEVVMIGAMVAYTVIVTLVGANTGLPPVVIVLLGTAGRHPGLHGRRLHARTRRLSAVAPRAAPGAADHRDRPVDHPAAPGADHLEPQPVAVSADHQDRFLSHHGDARRRDDHQRAGRDHRRIAGDDGRPPAARLPDEARHRDARHRAEPGGRGPHGHRHQPGDLADVRDRRRARAPSPA